MAAKFRFAFVGFRHPHIFELWDAVKTHPDCEIVAACEPDIDTRRTLHERGEISISHEEFELMLTEVSCEIVAVGDVYVNRGEQAIRTLESNHHLISDKPICTKMTELFRIETLAREKALKVGCQLDLTASPTIRRLREVVLSGALGRLATVTISAQHPLRYGTRPSWYFEPGCHGGVLNDIGIHAFDLLPWLTGSRWLKLLTSRAWNCKAVDTPFFRDCAQFQGILEGEISCFTDVSYLAPNKMGSRLPNYWRITIHGSNGMAETSAALDQVTVVLDGDESPSKIPGLPGPPSAYLNDFLAEIRGATSVGGLNTERVILASRLALLAQGLADSSSSVQGEKHLETF